MELRYETATQADIDLIFQLSKQLIEQYEDLSAIDCSAVMQWVRRKITNHIGTYCRILRDGQLAGFYRFVPNGDQMELDDLYILPPFQGMGIGSSVLSRCCAADDPIMLYVFSENRRAIALYERFGFQVSEPVGSTRLIMRRPGRNRQEAK